MYLFVLVDTICSCINLFILVYTNKSHLEINKSKTISNERREHSRNYKRYSYNWSTYCR